MSEPNTVLASYLIAEGFGKLPSRNNPKWQIYTDSMPDVGNDVLCVYTTSGLKDGRIMKTGETILRPGIQVRVRSQKAEEGYDKLEEIQKELDKVKRVPVVLPGVSYQINSITTDGTIIPLGLDDKNRWEHTLNVTMSIKEL